MLVLISIFMAPTPQPRKGKIMLHESYSATITTKYLGTSNRIKASCERGSIMIAFDYAGSTFDSHAQAVQALVDRFIAEDAEQYGSNPQSNPWSRDMVGGGIKGGYTFVFLNSKVIAV